MHKQVLLCLNDDLVYLLKDVQLGLFVPSIHVYFSSQVHKQV